MVLAASIEINSNLVQAYHQRSEKAGLSPQNQVLHHHVTQEDLAIIFQEKKNLMQVTEPFLYDLYHSVENTGFFLELLDEKGVILYMIGDDTILSRVKATGMGVGAKMDLYSVGTNAIAISMGENAPCQLQGQDHFLSIFNQFTCSCAPIHNQSGETLGYINLNGYNDYANRHTLGLVVAATKAVMNQLLYENTLNEIDYAHRVTNSVIESIQFGILTIDHQGKIIFINSFARRLINDFTVTGNTIYDYFLGDDLKRQILAAKEIDNAHYILKSSMEELIIESHYIIRNDGSTNGFVIVLKTIDSILDIASKYTDFKAKATFQDFISADMNMINVLRYAQKMSDSPSSVYLYGEKGVGKTMIAESIHNASDRSHMPFATVNCALQSQEELIYDLFGNRDLAYNTQKGYTGKLNASLRGTILIREIEHMPFKVQNSLLDYIRNKKSKGDGFYSRIISTSSLDLEDAVKKGRFNIELFYELSIIPIMVPPLRDRPADIKSLIHHFLGEKIFQLHKPPLQLEQSVLNTLYQYDYKGNVNELKNIMERLVNLNGKLEFDLNLKENQHTHKDSINFKIDRLSLQEIEEIAIKNCLKNNDYNYAVSAKKLGISRGTLYNKLKKINA